MTRGIPAAQSVATWAWQREALEALARGAAVDDVLARVCEGARQALPDAGIVVLRLSRDGVRLRHAASAGFPAGYAEAIDGVRVAPEGAPCGLAASCRERVVVPDVRRDPAWASFLDVASRFRIVAAASQPLLSPDGELLGTFAIARSAPGPLAPLEAEVLTSGARLAAIALERRRIESRLRLYAEIVAKATDAIGTVGADGTYVAQNAAHRALTQYDDEDLVGKTPEIHLGKEGFAAVLDALRRDGEFRGELPSRRKDGSYLDVDLVAFTVRDEDGGVACHVGIKRDVTGRKRAEASLHREVARLRAVHDLSATVASADDLDAILAAALDGVRAGLGADRASVLLFDGDGAMRFRAWHGLSASYRAAVEGHSPWPRDAPDPRPILVPDVAAADLGAVKDVVVKEGIRACAFVPLVHQGRLLGKFMAYYDAPHEFPADEVRLAETLARHVAIAVARHEAARELDSSRRNLQDFVETSAIGLHWVGPDGTILWANEADHAFLGYARDEYVGEDIRRFHADRDVIEDILARLTRGERLTEYPARLRARDGTVRHVLIDSSVLWDNGKFVHTRCFTRDVTARKRAEEELAVARRQLAASEKMSALGTLVSGVAHEVRTPLTYVANNVHLAREALGRGDADAARACLQECLEGVDRINRLVGELRRFTRASLGGRRPEDPVAAVREAVDLFQATHKGRCNVELVASAAPPVLGDRVQLQQVVLNLLENAADADPRGTLRVRVDGVRDTVRIVVEDSGPGIDPELRDRVFAPFFTTKPDGTGLGLSIVQRIVQDHGGTVRVGGAPGRGASFEVLLPSTPA